MFLSNECKKTMLIYEYNFLYYIKQKYYGLLIDPKKKPKILSFKMKLTQPFLVILCWKKTKIDFAKCIWHLHKI